MKMFSFLLYILRFLIITLIVVGTPAQVKALYKLIPGSEEAVDTIGPGFYTCESIIVLLLVTDTEHTILQSHARPNHPLASPMVARHSPFHPMFSTSELQQREVLNVWEESQAKTLEQISGSWVMSSYEECTQCSTWEMRS